MEFRGEMMGVVCVMFCTSWVEVVSESAISADGADDFIAVDLETVKTLYTALLTPYDTRIRPRKNQSDTVDIRSIFVPNNIIEFDTTHQKFSILGYFQFYWRDELLTWNPENYTSKPSTTPSLASLSWSEQNGTGLNTVKLPIRNMWTPNIILAKAFGGNGKVGDSKSDVAKLSANGDVQWVPEGIYSVVCEVDIQYYPFDEQICVLTYYVSDETFKTVSLIHDGEIPINEFIENSAWELIELTQARRTIRDAHFIDISFRIQRRAFFTTFTLISPLLMLAFLNIGVFLVPIGSGEKGSFSITIFLSYGIYFTIVSNTLPHNSLEVSYFVLFIVALLVISVLSVLYVIVQSKLFNMFGDKECNVTLFCIRKPTNNKVTITTEKDNAKKPEYTWGSFFEKLDVWLFGIFFIVISLSTAVFFALMMQRIHQASFDKIKGIVADI